MTKATLTSRLRRKQRNLKKKAVTAMGILLILTMLLSGGVLWIRQINRQSAIDTSLAWTRMSPLPESAKRIDVEVGGSLFTREFEVEFQASEADIKDWLVASPGVSFSPRDSISEGTVGYTISESDALFAQVTVDWETLTVLIHTYWS
ncbi:MAG: hypothetical protein AAF528_09895 [Cyanobacteria bacterium P01_C01_bin.121]